MATRDVKNIKEHLICAICLGSYNDPRTLPCDHSFCLECLTTHITETEHINSFSCPSCRENVSFTNSKSDSKAVAVSFPQNTFLADIEKRVRLHESEAPECKFHKKIPAEYCCTADETYLCTDCAVTTHRSNTCKVVKLQEVLKNVKSEFDKLKGRYEAKSATLTNMLTKEYKNQVPKIIKSNTVQYIESFEERFGEFVQMAYQQIENIKEEIKNRKYDLPDQYDSKLQEIIRDIEKGKEDIVESNALGISFAFRFKNFKKQMHKKLKDADERTKSLTQSVFVEHWRIKHIFGNNLQYNILGTEYLSLEKQIGKGMWNDF